jgi:pimeloyl-ACP methyl ester carboxylesterase
MGVLPKDFLATYEMPGAIVSSEPDLCVEALRRLVDDAKEVTARAGVGKEHLVVLGWSMGNGPATYFANSMGARLHSIASADRGDLLLWESPVVRDIKERAIRKGYRLQDFAEASRGYHPSENLANLRPGSKFVISLRDEFVPRARREGLVRAVRRHAPGAEITYCDAGHVKTIVAMTSGTYR